MLKQTTFFAFQYNLYPMAKYIWRKKNHKTFIAKEKKKKWNVIDLETKLERNMKPVAAVQRSVLIIVLRKNMYKLIWSAYQRQS